MPTAGAHPSAEEELKQLETGLAQGRENSNNIVIMLKYLKVTRARAVELQDGSEQPGVCSGRRRGRAVCRHQWWDMSGRLGSI